MNATIMAQSKEYKIEKAVDGGFDCKEKVWKFKIKWYDYEK